MTGSGGQSELEHSRSTGSNFPCQGNFCTNLGCSKSGKSKGMGYLGILQCLIAHINRPNPPIYTYTHTHTYTQTLVHKKTHMQTESQNHILGYKIF